jgi:hypothetical protein
MRATRNAKRVNQHTACVYSGELVFDRLLRRCPRCHGTVVYLAEQDLTTLGRHRPRPINPPAVDE